MTGATTGADRGVPKVRVLFGTERFSSQHVAADGSAPRRDHT
jgi:hypothetical protein